MADTLGPMTIHHASGQCEFCPTRQLCLGADLDADALHALGDCIRPSAPMRKGDYLFRAGDPVNGCFIVRSGVYKSFAVNTGGEEYVTGFYYPGELLGLSGLADSVQQESAMAIETGTACRVPIDALPQLWSLGTGRSLLRLLGRNGQQATEARISLSQSKADCRVAQFLLNLAERMQVQGRDPRVLPAPMSRTDLASYLGMTLESLSRVFARLSKAGLISATRTEITLHSPDQLQTLAYHLAD
jgi:CRP/FNR family transcriptional regulator